MNGSGKKEKPFFSIIICTYNREKLLRRAVDSLVNQDEKDWECIIIDDGSSDGTFAICREYADSFKNISYTYRSNKGLGLSRNDGIRQSEGKYISFLDSDDEYALNHLSSRKDILLNNPDTGLLHGGAEIIGDPFVPDASNPANKIHINECAIGGTFFIRRDIALVSGGFANMNFGDDADFFKKIQAMGIKIIKTELMTYRYYRNAEDSICNKLI